MSDEVGAHGDPGWRAREKERLAEEHIHQGFYRMRFCPDETRHDWTEKIFTSPEMFTIVSTCRKCGYQLKESEER